ncbi:hypothetical protein M3_0119 [Lysinibacillus phage vB_LfM_LysYB1]|nr:hypothetical protein M3_0119 [Lysinibacillus phage vB_LfM_LysYB1]WAB25371.1 hypothetical protein M5_0193 [Lysinibacillus phage vB_LfM_LysYB2]
MKNRPEIADLSIKFSETFYYRITDESRGAMPFASIRIEANRIPTEEEYEHHHHNDVRLVVATEYGVPLETVIPISREEFQEHVDTSAKPGETIQGNFKQIMNRIQEQELQSGETLARAARKFLDEVREDNHDSN